MGIIENKNAVIVLDNLFEGYTICKPIFNKKKQLVDFEYIELNQKYADIIKRKKKDLLHKKYSTIFPEKQITKEWSEEFNRLLKESSVGKYEIFFDKISIWYEVTIMLLDHEYFLTTYTNINKRKNTESELTRNSRLLEEKNIELENFASVISHDLKGKLQIISLLNSYNKDSKEKIDNEIEKITKFLDDLLFLARKGKVVSDFETIDLNEFVNSTLTSIKAISKDIQFKVKELPKIKGDKVRLNQVFDNILMNILKHSNATEVMFSAMKLDNYWKISITDNGTGISDEKMKEIEDTIKKSDFKNLGLLIVKKIMESHNGAFEIYTERDNGTTCNLLFPA